MQRVFLCSTEAVWLDEDGRGCQPDVKRGSGRQRLQFDHCGPQFISILSADAGLGTPGCRMSE